MAIDFEVIKVLAKSHAILTHRYVDVHTGARCLLCHISPESHQQALMNAKEKGESLVYVEDSCPNEVLPQWMAWAIPRLTDAPRVSIIDVVEAAQIVHHASKEKREEIRLALTEKLEYDGVQFYLSSFFQDQEVVPNIMIQTIKKYENQNG